MCGIVGYVGTKRADPVLLKGLQRLEYRGYDSSGIGVFDPVTSRIVVRKSKGKIRDLQNLIEKKPFPDNSLGISHTRWATHGEPNKINAHPHLDASGRILLVHNGIIENYEDLRRELEKKKVRFVSQTDTEVIVQLIGSLYKGDLLKAVGRAVRKLKGAFAIGVISAEHPDQIVAARVGSPLIIGVKDGAHFIASDAPAILDQTNQVIYLQDNQMARLTADTVEIFDFQGKALAKPKIEKIQMKMEDVQKSGYDHFMLKEIHEQPVVLEQMLKLRVKKGNVVLEELGLSNAQIKGVRRVHIVACGTAYHAGMVGRYIIERLSGVSVSVDVSSEFRYRDPIIDKKDLVVAISQSGETADTLAAVKEARRRGAKVVSIVNVIGSSLSRESDGVLYTHAGPEIGVASTKAYTAQLAMLYLLAIVLGDSRFPDRAAERKGMLAGLKKTPALYRQILADVKTTAKIARENAHFGCFLFLGRNINFPTALEGALKLKEISYIPAEGYAAGEMKHGPIALIDEYRAVVCLATQSETYEKMISNIEEIKSRKGKVIAIATEGDKKIGKHVDHVISIPRTHTLLTPLLAALPLQLIAYHISVKRGCDVDQPRNLAKSVTVE